MTNHNIINKRIKHVGPIVADPQNTQNPSQANQVGIKVRIHAHLLPQLLHHFDPRPAPL